MFFALFVVLFGLNTIDHEVETFDLPIMLSPLLPVHVYMVCIINQIDVCLHFYMYMYTYIGMYVYF